MFLYDSRMADLRTERKALGLTQKALAKRLGKTPETVSRYENGHLSIPHWVWNELGRIDWSRRLQAVEQRIAELEERVK